jgi:hypothetical protein
MEKLVYLLSDASPPPAADLRAMLIEKSAAALRDAGASRISVNVHDEDVAAGSGVTIRNAAPPIQAMVSFWMECADDRADCEQTLRQVAPRIDGYLTVESRPLIHQPPLGERTPGFNLVTCIDRKPGLSDDDFFEHWNIEHKATAFETQSTFSYVRNAVVRPLTAETPVRAGIVEEAFPIEALSNPHVWYDCDSEPVYHERLQRMVASVSAFLDLGRLDSIPMSEYFLG